MKIWLVMFILQEMQILHVKLVIKHSRTIDEDFGFMPNLIQIIIDIVTLGTNQIYHGIVQHIFPIFPLIQSWQCEMELLDMHPYQSMWQWELHSNKKSHVMDSLLMKMKEALRNPLLKSMAFHTTLIHQRPLNLITPLLMVP
jgi:hypothetical protein